mmetsp:Transcript_12215/g.17361  ORF Transcript_12215/g.17361 Transcript_12215/m.17361 type:complete len:202 (+) Transcript_12215:126-731(+)
MFKRFDPSTDVSTSTQVKASVQRNLKSQILSTNPKITEEQLEVVLPKKPPLIQYKVGPHLMLYCSSDEEQEPLLFQSRDGPILPTLKFVHAYPDLKFRHVVVDEGAIPFILGGANIMCPGLTSKGGWMPPDDDDVDVDVNNKGEGLEKGDGIVIYADGKDHALAVGVMKMGSRTVRSKNKGIGIEVAHFLGDGLYQTNEIS